MNEELFYVNLFGDMNVRTSEGPRLVAFGETFELGDAREVAKAVALRLSLLAEMGLITINADALKLEV